ncbi:GCN5-like N-acetyltransferase [Oxalobacteraceae bacterium IMCC9480]|nr:GCN5-like N-acetyltransferase [Oxalobacteraceae bacterium IMCC9480]NDP60231.1 GNAT family N-acetyltransferase [Oxalobacteraceae bacterium]
MTPIAPVTLELHGVRLEPMAAEHAPALAAAAADGELWTLRVTSAPAPGDEAAYIATALNDRTRLPFIVRDIASNAVIGTTSYHDIVPALGRVEIGHTWYARTWQRTHVNTTCKWLLLRHAFEVLGCGVVGFRADNFNLVSQDAIARLGAKRDGVIRHHALRRDGTVRDTVMFSIVAGEWPEINAHLTYKLAQRGKRC